jgi:hypothetical protein
MSENSNGDKIIEIAELMNNLKGEELAVRLKSVRSLSIISDFIGQERTRNEMIPFLMSLDGFCFATLLFFFFKIVWKMKRRYFQVLLKYWEH